MSDDNSPSGKRMMLVVIDGLGAAPLRRAMAEGHAPHLAELITAGGRFDEAISPFPSLTPVCLATIITGGGPDRHRIPSLSWYQRGEGRFVEYGSSFAAATVEGTRRTIEDTVVNLNHVHLATEPRTLFEIFQDDDRMAASINFLIWRGRTRHTIRHDYRPVSAIARRNKVHAVYGPDHFYFGELYGATRPVLPQVGFKRPKDWGGGLIARHLLKSTATQFIL
ncbi:MAG: alkaline phosphatase family protein, partial [Thermoleophilia bacterium]|nr:alkaline phosphatase family protein [Thermoleophilia bacterium]